MIAEEQARADVEAWLQTDARWLDGLSTIDSEDMQGLISRLTPVYKRARAACVGCAYEVMTGQRVARPPGHTCRSLALYKERDALRERAERAEAELALAAARLGWKKGEVVVDRLEAAEVDVARLRDALSALAGAEYRDDDDPVLEEARLLAQAALAATEPRR